MRHDAYLYGSPYAARFRSTNEFVPHAYVLYCVSNSCLINYRFWLKTSQTLDNSECSCKYCAKKKSQRDVNESVFGEPSQSKPRITKPPRIKDLGSEASVSSRSFPRPDARFKNIRLRLPFTESDLPDTVAYAARKRYTELHEGRIIRDGELVWIPLSRSICSPENPTIGIDYWPAFAHDIDYRKEVIQDKDGISYSVKEQVYIVTRPLISGTTNVRVLESSIIPFRAWELDEFFVRRLQEILPPHGFGSTSDFNSTSESIIFSPKGCHGELRDDVTFARAAPYYALAVQTAVQMDKYWTPMYQIEPGPSRSGTFYQGLWLGAERIWLDDLVRIHLDHNDLMTHSELQGRICPPEAESETRSIFMRITEIVVDDVVTPDGPRKVLRVAGPAYYCVPDPAYTLARDDPGYLSAANSNDIKGVTHGVHFPMPIPPIGFQYKPLSPFDEELVLDGFMIAGRYYSRLLWNTAFNLDYIQQHKENWWIVLISMCGLMPGKFSRCNAQFLMRKRKEAAESSQREALKDLIKMWNGQRVDNDVEMR